MFDGPAPAAPENSGDPLNTTAILDPTASSSPSTYGCIFETMCWRNSSDPSLMGWRPAPNRPSNPSSACSLATTFFWSFHSTPNGGLASM